MDRRLYKVKFGKLAHISALNLGDVVRPCHDVQKIDDPKFKDNWYFGSVLGSANDFRSSYDCQTVVKVTEDLVYFARPYLYVYNKEDGEHGGIERWHAYRDHTGLFYEVIREGDVLSK